MNPTAHSNLSNRIPGRAWRLDHGHELRFGRFCRLWLAAGGLTWLGLGQRAAGAPMVVPDPSAVIASPAPTGAFQTIAQQNTPNEMDVFQGVDQPTVYPLPQIFRYGPLELRPHGDYSFSYGNGILNTPGNPEASIVQQVSPGFRADLGTHWAVDYTPTFMFYSSDKFRNVVNQSAILTGDIQYADWKFGLTQSVMDSSSPLVETGTQTDRTSYGTGLTASRALSSKMSADFGLNQNIALAPAYNDSYTWSTLDWLNYQFWPRFNVGLGAGAGYVMVVENNQVHGTNHVNFSQDLDQTYEELQARANWRATDKISFSLSGGLNDRQFMSAGSSDSLSPIFSASIQYLPFAHTQITLSANEMTASSTLYLAAQETTTTRVGLNLTQQLFRQFTLTMGVAYLETEYSTPAGGATANTANRTDDHAMFDIRLSHPIFKRGTVSIFYHYADNSSNQQGYSFDSNQTGFEIGYRF